MCPLDPDELNRLLVLQSLELIDTPPEPLFDDLTKIAARLCQTPIAILTLLDRDRQFFKSKHGLAASGTPREVSFCTHAIQKPGLFIINDAREDPRFCQNPLVLRPPFIRFYAGVPLVLPSGHALGTLCVIDRVPRELSAEQGEYLRMVGRQVMALLELRERRRRDGPSEAFTALETAASAP
jgi:GAF domain-containing protein